MKVKQSFSSKIVDLGEPGLKPSDWPHNPIFVQAGDQMEAIGIKRGSPVPLGVPFEVGLHSVLYSQWRWISDPL